VVFVDALSYGATGKIQKMELRSRFAGHYASREALPKELAVELAVQK
jgi:3-(methylthio)propionyl---CoA ligase